MQKKLLSVGVILLILVLGICLFYSIHKGFSSSVRVIYDSFEMEFNSNITPKTTETNNENKDVLP